MEESLTSFIEKVYGEDHFRVEDDLGGGFVRLRTAEAERRQAQHDIRTTEDIIIEMLRNARDAGARNIFVALSREGSMRRICMIDDGEGIPEHLHATIFEPRVTSKIDSIHMDTWGIHGRGMALFSIHSHAEEACVVCSAPHKGAAFLVATNLEILPERTDQSTLPAFSFDKDNLVHVRGPHNISRIIAEFAYDARETCNVYCGSPTDIVATLYDFGETTVSKSIRMFCKDPQELPLVKQLCLAADPGMLTTLAHTLGLEVSERSARRILEGNIKSLSSEYELIVQQSIKPSLPSAAKNKKRLVRDARGLKVHPDDLAEFSQGIKEAFEVLAEAYYLESSVNPEIQISHDRIQVSIPFTKL